MRNLEEIRVDIDKVDDEIKRLYRDRLFLAKEVAEYKIAMKKEVFDPQREAFKIKKLTEDILDKDVRIGVEGLFNKLMTDSKRLQYELVKDMDNSCFDFSLCEDFSFSDVRVAYQGEPGAYSQEAANKYFGEKGEIFNVKTWRDAMDAVVSKKADFCVLPIENSTAGSVTEVYDLLTEYEGLNIIGEQVINISHMLLGLKGSTLSDIKTVYSHPQAIFQCGGFFRENPRITAENMINTALSAKKVRDDRDKSQAAIAGIINADIYGLEVIKSSIQDEDNNKTRFVVLSDKKWFFKGANKISITFCLRHERGSLFNALSFLSDNDINLTRIESRPIRTRNWEYRFFVDMEGSLKDKQIQRAMYGLMDVTSDLRILGNY